MRLERLDLLTSSHHIVQKQCVTAVTLKLCLDMALSQINSKLVQRRRSVLYEDR